MGLQRQHLTVNSETFEHYYLCNYRPQSKGSDKLSKSLLRFKSGCELDVAAWTACALMEMSKIPFDSGFLILRVLYSYETVVEGKHKTPLDLLGLKIAKNYHGRYEPNLLHKIRETQKAKLLSGSERARELEDVYSFTTNAEPADQKTEILILDDILTTGTTMSFVIMAIRKVLPESQIRLFTLACTDSQSFLNQGLKLKGYSYSWESEEGWVIAEGSEMLYSDLNKLKHRILNDSFD